MVGHRLIVKVLFIFHYALAVAEIPKELFIPVNIYIVVISLMAAGRQWRRWWRTLDNLARRCHVFLSDISAARTNSACANS